MSYGSMAISSNSHNAPFYFKWFVIVGFDSRWYISGLHIFQLIQHYLKQMWGFTAVFLMNSKILWGPDQFLLV